MNQHVFALIHLRRFIQRWYSHHAHIPQQFQLIEISFTLYPILEAFIITGEHFVGIGDHPAVHVDISQIFPRYHKRITLRMPQKPVATNGVSPPCFGVLSNSAARSVQLETPISRNIVQSTNALHHLVVLDLERKAETFMH